MDAISQKTGEELWTSQVADPSTGAYESMAPTSYDGKSSPARLTLKTIEGTTIALDPFPFDVNPLRVQLIRREVDRSVFPDPAAFREAYFKATPVAVDFTLCSQPR